MEERNGRTTFIDEVTEKLDRAIAQYEGYSSSITKSLLAIVGNITGLRQDIAELDKKVSTLNVRLMAREIQFPEEPANEHPIDLWSLTESQLRKIKPECKFVEHLVTFLLSNKIPVKNLAANIDIAQSSISCWLGEHNGINSTTRERLWRYVSSHNGHNPWSSREQFEVEAAELKGYVILKNARKREAKK